MPRIKVLITTVAFTFSGIAISPASTAEISEVMASGPTFRFAASEPAIAIPATFGPGIQDNAHRDYFSSVSCPSAGNCVAAGQFTNAAGFQVAFTQTQTNGVWEIGNPATFGADIQNISPNSYFSAISCPSAGNCVATGSFSNATGGSEVFTQTQTNGVWDSAIPATFGDGIQNSNRSAYANSLSCPSVGSCVVAGSFRNATGGNEAFTQTQTNGQWTTAIPATFATGIQNTYQNDYFSSVACSSPGNCVAAGRFKNADVRLAKYEAFTQTQTNGQWAAAIPATFVAGIQNTDPNARFSSVSCPSAGNCVAAGMFINAAELPEAFTQTQTNGQWATASPATFGLGIQYSNPASSFQSISCPSTGNCVAAGEFQNAMGGNEAFTQTQTNGQWATAIPATFAAGIQNSYQEDHFNSVACSSPGNCVAVGYFENASTYYEAFTQTQTNGRWATAIPTTFGAGIQSATPNAYLGSVACSSGGSCVAVGEFVNAAGGYEAFSQNITQAFDAPAVTPATKPTNASKFVNFATSSSLLTKTKKDTLRKLVTKSGKKATFVVTGTAGKLPGVTDKKIKALATKRGETVKAYLVSLGVSKSKVTVIAKITNQGIVPKTKILAKFLVDQ